MKFSKLYESLTLDPTVFKKCSDEESIERKKKWDQIKLQQIVDEIVDKTKLNDGSWHIHSQLNLAHLKLESLDGLNVSIIDGYFDCSWNKLKSLKGAPQITKNSFKCDYNRLTSLEGAPIFVGKYFNCSNNKLTSLEGAPKEVIRDFDCWYDPNIT